MLCKWSQFKRGCLISHLVCVLVFVVVFISTYAVAFSKPFHSHSNIQKHNYWAYLDSSTWSKMYVERWQVCTMILTCIKTFGQCFQVCEEVAEHHRLYSMLCCLETLSKGCYRSMSGTWAMQGFFSYAMSPCQTLFLSKRFDVCQQKEFPSSCSIVHKYLKQYVLGGGLLL